MSGLVPPGVPLAAQVATQVPVEDVADVVVHAPLASGAALFSACAWALASLLFARLLSHTSRADRPSAAGANLFKNLVACGVFGVLALLLGDEWPGLRTTGVLMWSGFLGFAVGDTLYFAALPRCGVQSAATVVLLNVPVAAMGSWLWLGERLRPVTLLFMAVVVAGVVLVVRSGPDDPTTDRARHRAGVWMALGVAVMIGLAVVFGRYSMEAVAVLPGASLRLLGGAAGAFLCSAVLGLLPGRRASSEVRELVRPLRTPRLWGVLALATFSGSVVGLGPYTYALRELPGGISAVLFATTPLFTLPVGLLFGQRPRAQVVVGTVVGFLGVTGVLLTGGAPG